MDRYTFAENKIRKSHKLIIDTSSIMELCSLSLFVDTYSDILLIKKIIILPSVYAELMKHMTSADEHKKRLACSALQYLQKQHQIFIFPEASFCSKGKFADADILEYLLSARTDFVTLLITQDRKLAMDAMALNGISSCHGNKVFACRLDGYGFFQTFTFNSPQQHIKSDVIRVIDTHNLNMSKAVSPQQQKTYEQKKTEFPSRDWAVGVMLGAFLFPIGKHVVRLLRGDENE